MTRPNSNNSEKISEKEPWLAVNLSYLFPGIGQIYSGNLYKGLLQVLLLGWGEIILVGSILINPTDKVARGLIWLSFCLLLYNLFDAYQTATRVNSRNFEADRRSNKDAWRAVFFTMIIPGLGHIYIGKRWLGIIIIIGWLVIPLIMVFFTFSLDKILITILLSKTVISILNPFIIYHVYTAAPVRRETTKKWILAIAISLIIVPIIISFPTRIFLASTFYISSESMTPTLQVNDRIIVDKLISKFSNLQRGDIIVFSPTEELRKELYEAAFLERIIGLPGENVELKDGEVYINSKPLLEDKYLTPEQRTLIDVCTVGESSPYLAKRVTIPLNSYLTLGDNRNNSYDSRCWGVVPKDNIIGKTVKIFWPLKRIRPF